jgi:hypothetical protein
LSLLFFNIWVQNALKLACVHLSDQKIFRGLYPRTPVLKEREGKAKGRVGLEGMEGREWEGKKDQGEGKEGRGGRGKGRRIVKAGAP